MARGGGSEVRAAAQQIQAESWKFMGAPLPDEMGPAEILLERVKVMGGYVRWLDGMIKQWPDKLVKLGMTNRDSKGSMQAFPTEKAAWLAEWHRASAELVNFCAIALKANIDERRVSMAEKESETIMNLLTQAFDRLELTEYQLGRVPIIMGEIIRNEISGGSGEPSLG